MSCKKNADTTPSSTLNSTILQGQWRISFFDDSGNIETNHFTGYAFQFHSNGTVTATNGSQTVNGVWTQGNDNSQAKLLLNFGNNVPFDDLNEDWHVLVQNANQIMLQHVSGGNGGTDNLHFEKM